MRTLKILIVGLSLLAANATQAQTVKADTVVKAKTECPCDRKQKRNKKKTGEKRTKAGKVLFDILTVTRELIPFLSLLIK